MARAPRTFSSGGDPEAKAAENIVHGKPREDVTEKTEQANPARSRAYEALTDSPFEPPCGTA